MISREFVQREKRMMRKLHETVPVVYAAFCVALHRRYKFGYQRILNVLIDTQDLFVKHGNGEIDILTICSEETGIDVLSEQTAKENDVEGKRI